MKKFSIMFGYFLVAEKNLNKNWLMRNFCQMTVSADNSACLYLALVSLTSHIIKNTDYVFHEHTRTVVLPTVLFMCMLGLW